MRAPLLALLLATLPPAAAGQQAFSDPDFGFSLQVPSGLVPLDEAGRRKILGDAEAARNVPRADAGGQPVHHRHFWLDQSSPYHRQVVVYLLDVPPPFDPGKPEEFAAAMRKDGMTVVSQERLKPPAFGLRVEGTFLREQDEVPMHRVVVYLPDVFGRRHGIVTLQAQESDWSIVKDEFQATLASMQLVRTPPPPEVVESAQKAAAAAGGAAPGRPPGAPASAPPAEDPGDWGSLPVLGSFVLAVAVLAHLLLSARTPR